MKSAKQLGQFGEDLVQDYLCRRGYTILETNYRTREGEIDIIAKQGKTLRFVEVKSRHRINSPNGEALEAVNILKQRRLQKAMYAFLDTYSQPVDDYSIDVAVVHVTIKKARIIYYPNALEASYDA